MFVRILIGGLVGGVVGGLILSGLLAVSTTPLILHAEKFETAEALRTLSIVLVHDGSHTTAPAGFDTTRLLMTGIATIAIAVGYMWLLLGAMFAKGHEITARSVIPWAVAGFFAAGLAPAFGLAPELPGSAAADLGARQLWWIGTALATAGGIALIAFSRQALLIAAGIALIALPHVIGAPHPTAPASKAPAEVAAHFASASLVIHALTWLIPAAIAGFTVAWMARRAGTPRPATAA